VNVSLVSISKICKIRVQVTTIRRYGGNTTRSRIPIGSFYGHTFIFPWEKEASTAMSEDSTEAGTHSVILSQLNIYTALLEEVQCRYSLACKNLVILLSAAENNHTGQAHYLQFFLKRGKRTDDDNRIIQAYHECCQLQVGAVVSLSTLNFPPFSNLCLLPAFFQRFCVRDDICLTNNSTLL